MSSDRDTRARLEWVQTRLQELEPELGLAESPGHSEQLAALQVQVREARHAAKDAQDRVAYVRSELDRAQREVSAMNLVAQAKQTQTLPGVLWPVLGILAVPATFFAMISLALEPGFPAELAGALSISCAFGIGVVMRARVYPPQKKK